MYKSDEFEEVSTQKCISSINLLIFLFKVKGKLESVATKEGILYTNEAIYEFLISRVRMNLHIVLCMSPIGDDFRNRLR